MDSRGCWTPGRSPSSLTSPEYYAAQGQVVLSKRGVFAFSAPLGTDPHNLHPHSFAETELPEEKKEKDDGHRSRVLGRG